MRRNQQSGFTLVELIMVIIITGLITAAVSQIIAQGFNAYLSGKNATEADWQGRVAMERMARDLRMIQSPSSITTATSNQIVYTDTTGTSITYQLSGTTLQRNSQTLATGINSLTLSYFDKTGTSTGTLTAIRYITISLNITQSNANYTLTTSIYPRNLS